MVSGGSTAVLGTREGTGMAQAPPLAQPGHGWQGGGTQGHSEHSLEKLTKEATASSMNIARGCGGTRTQLWWHQNPRGAWFFVK